MPSLCCACETDIVLKLENSSDVPDVVQGGELSEAEKLVERALDVTLNPKAPFICKNCYQFISNTEQNTRKTGKNLEKLEIRLKPNA